MSKQARHDPEKTLEFVVTLTAKLYRDVVAAGFEHLGLNQTQGYILVYLNSTTVQWNQTQLSERLGIRKAAVGLAIDVLEARGMVIRSLPQQDRRSKIVALTSAGRALAIEAGDVVTEIGDAVRKGLTADERRAAASALLTMQANLREELERAESGATVAG
jgi:MarR family transcriptional regulator for hemolysin